MIGILVALGLLGATAGVGLWLWQATVAAQEANRALFRDEAFVAEAGRLRRMDDQLTDAQRLSEAAVAGGTDLVRAVHKGIAAIPFGILEAIPVTRDTTKVVRVTHDAISDVVYGSIGAVNKGVGGLLRAGLAARKPAVVAQVDPAAAAAEGITARTDRDRAVSNAITDDRGVGIDAIADDRSGGRSERPP